MLFDILKRFFTTATETEPGDGFNGQTNKKLLEEVGEGEGEGEVEVAATLAVTSSTISISTTSHNDDLPSSAPVSSSSPQLSPAVSCDDISSSDFFTDEVDGDNDDVGKNEEVDGEANEVVVKVDTTAAKSSSLFIKNHKGITPDSNSRDVNVESAGGIAVVDDDEASGSTCAATMTTCTPAPTCNVDEDDSIEPAYYFEENGVPVFTPTMDQFNDFKTFVKGIEKYGMVSGIVKIVPPKEWKDSLVDLQPHLSKLKVKHPIIQQISSGGLPAGAYQTFNFESRRSYSVNDWFRHCMSNEMREPQYDNDGELRMAKLARSSSSSRKRKSMVVDDALTSATTNNTIYVTPEKSKSSADLLDNNIGTKTPASANKTTTSLSPEKAEEAEKLLLQQMRDYCSTSAVQFSRVFCEALERFYWKNISYGPAKYGADLLGSLFDKSKCGGSWNLNRLDNLLTKLEMPLPGVNQAYLYFGMWKATFSWHVEDMDLYSINYIHFGAPKQWYVVPPANASRFERFAASIFPKDYNKCHQFLRHKQYIISPRVLKSNSIPVNRCVQGAGEFIITFPNGYHQGYNLGFNCAESVNFANDSWIQFGKNAKFCTCIGDSVQLDVKDLFLQNAEKKLVNPSMTLTSVYDALPESKPKKQNCGGSSSGNSKSLESSQPAPPPPPPKLPPKECVLCAGIEGEMLDTDMPGKFAHKICALFINETSVMPSEQDANAEVAVGLNSIPLARWRLKCDLCKAANDKSKSKRGAPIQCIKGKCVRAYHVSCALNAGLHMYQDGSLPFSECYCPQHDPNAIEEKRRRIETQIMSIREQLLVGSKVIVKSTTGGSGLYEGFITEILETSQSCMVYFEGSNRLFETSWSNIKSVENVVDVIE